MNEIFLLSCRFPYMLHWRMVGSPNAVSGLHYVYLNVITIHINANCIGTSSVDITFKFYVDNSGANLGLVM